MKLIKYDVRVKVTDPASGKDVKRVGHCTLRRPETADEAIEIANSTRFALTGGIYSRSPVNIEKVREGLMAGNIYINRKITGALVERQPFGGFKMSGLGSKAGGSGYLLNFLFPVSISENTLRRGFAPEE